jgi:hypothetical protein
MDLFTTANPILSGPITAATSLEDIAAKAVHRRKLNANRRDLRDLRRAENCSEAVGPIDRETEIYGFTKGQFSVIDLLNHCLDYTGPARLVISTWTAANADVSTVLDMIERRRLTGARWLVDLTFSRRSPELAKRIRDVFGADAIRVAKNHAKFFTLCNDQWQIVCRSSMNLNFNPRFENFQLAHDPDLFAFHEAIIDEIWSRQRRELGDEARPYDIHKFFDEEM